MIRCSVVLALLLTGCAKDPLVRTVQVPYEVKVPVVVKATPPGELSRPYVPTELPVFVEPSHPSAKVALSETDLSRLKTILRTLTTRDEAWRQWAAPAGDVE
ncbi:hypothetical protein D3C85_691780 [compost metagenome]